MLTSGRRYLGLANHLAIWPGVAIMLAVMGLNFLGDGLIDALDPKYRKEMEPVAACTNCGRTPRRFIFSMRSRLAGTEK